MQPYAQAVRAIVAPGHCEAVLFDEIVDRDRAFMLLIGTAAIDGGVIEQDLAEASSLGGLFRAHDLSPRSSRSATERAWAAKSFRIAEGDRGGPQSFKRARVATQAATCA